MPSLNSPDVFRLFDEHVLQVRDEALRPGRQGAIIRKAVKQ